MKTSLKVVLAFAAIFLTLMWVTVCVQEKSLQVVGPTQLSNVGSQQVPLPVPGATYV